MLKFSPKLKETQIKRSKINDLLRGFFKEQGFLEVQTPSLVKCAGQEPYLTPMKVDFKDEKNKKYQGFLITSPEYSLKKLLSAGFDKIFELARVFRANEGFGGSHNPEFTMLEWYRADSDYRQIMKDTENLVFFLNKKINNSKYLNYQGKKIDLTLPWPRLSIKEAFLKYAKINLDKAKDSKSFRSQIKNKRYPFNDWNDIFYSVFLNEIEPNLPKDRPIIIYDYPLPQASLAKRKSKGSFYAERFEVYIGGMELANAFSELTDPKEQRSRLVQEQLLRRKMGKDAIPLDEDFINALRLGILPSGGIALGMERLQMLLLDIKDINNLLPFPIHDLYL
ncbi:MAG: EF-P lysine aminoacylase EpmA [bacterium]|nr:EF-P lysine aminoacylase EpmA [bacterium]